MEAMLLSSNNADSFMEKCRGRQKASPTLFLQTLSFVVPFNLWNSFVPQEFSVGGLPLSFHADLGGLGVVP